MEHNDALISPKISQQILERLSYLMGVCLYKYNLNTKDISLNLNTTKVTGHSLTDLPNNGETRDSMIYPDDKELVYKNVYSIISGQKDHYHIEYRMIRKDGSIVWIDEVALISEYDVDGHPLYISALALDLSRLKDLEKQARDLSVEIKNLVIDSDHYTLAQENRLLRASNAAAASIIGGFYQDYEIVLQHSIQMLCESLQANYVCIWRNKLVEGELFCFQRAHWSDHSKVVGEKDEEHLFKYDDFLPDWRISLKEYNFATGDKNLLPDSFMKKCDIHNAESIILIPLYLHGEFWGTLGFTRSNKIPFEPYEVNAILSGAIIIASSVSRNETLGKINMAREQAIANTLAKSEFLSRMSHELRTPLNAIIGMTNIAIKEKDPSKIGEYLKKVEISSQLLLSIINDVLDISKIDAGKLEIIKEPFDFNKMLRNAENVVKFKMDEKKQKFIVNVDEEINHKIISDEHRLTQVIVNLLNNAMKFTPQEGEISLTAFQKQLNGNKVKLRVEVRDNGIGLSYQQQEKLFTAFEQADGSITRKYGGTGLGLAICKKILNMLGGDIWVISKPGQGSCFFFELETEVGDLLTNINVNDEHYLSSISVSSANQKDPTLEEEIYNWQDKTILLAEDVEINREIVEIMLADTNVKIISVTNGREAVDTFSAKPELFDLILMDVQMPILDGLSATKEIRLLNNGYSSKIPIIAMTANAFKEDIEICLKAGMNEHVAKPIIFDIFLKTLKQYFK